jgi:hypothetical protein
VIECCKLSSFDFLLSLVVDVCPRRCRYTERERERERERELALRIKDEFPHLDLCVFYLDDGVIIGNIVFQLIQENGPALGLHLNVKKNEIWWPCSSS